MRFLRTRRRLTVTAASVLLVAGVLVLGDQDSAATVVAPTTYASTGGVSDLGFDRGQVRTSRAAKREALIEKKKARERRERKQAEKAARIAARAEQRTAHVPNSTPAPPPGSNRALGKQMAASVGWTGYLWNCLDQLWGYESGWDHTAYNSSSGAGGIPQSLPASKMAAAGRDWQTNPATQIRWGLNYIDARYGTPCSALNHFHNLNWY